MIKEFYKKRILLVIVINILCLILAGFLSYHHSLPKRDERIFVFMTGQKVMKSSVLNELKEIGNSYGIVEVSSFSYDENDSYFSQAVATKGMYDTDLFIMSGDVALWYKDDGLFEVLSEEICSLGNEYLYNSEGEKIAISISDDYYLLLGKSGKSNELILELVKNIVKNGADMFE